MNNKLDMINEEENRMNTQLNEESIDSSEDNDKKNIENKLCEENNLLKDKLLRLAAEFDNFKKRSDRDQKISQKYANESLIIDILPILDNLDNVLDIKVDEQNPFLEGLRMIIKQFEDVLLRHNAKRENSVGCIFDPIKHEAIEYVEIDSNQSGKIVKEYQKCCWLHDRLIQPSKAVVAK